MAGFVTYPNPGLSKKAANRQLDASMLAAGAALLAAAQEVQAYGLAAAHLGLDEPVVVVSTAMDPAQRDYQVLYNPEVLSVSDEVVSGAEGSVSMPGIEVSVTRPVSADIAFDQANGTRVTSRFDGFAARVALHEIDQVNGIFFLQRVSKLKRDMATRKFQKAFS